MPATRLLAALQEEEQGTKGVHDARSPVSSPIVATGEFGSSG